MTLLLLGVFAFIVIGLCRGYIEAKDKKKYLTLSTLGLAVPILALFLFGPLLLLSPLKPGFSKIESGNIVVFYPRREIQIPLRRTPEGKMQEPELIGQKEIAQMALAYTQQTVKKNEQFYKIPVKAKVLLVLGETDLFRFSGIMRGGGTGNEFGIIIDEQFLNEKLISHELSHKTINNLLGPINSLKVPTWFDEGMATYIAGQDYYLSEEEARNLLNQGELDRNLSRWEGFFGKLRWKFTDIQKHGKIYGHVYLFTKYLFDNYGEDKMYELVLAVKKNSFEKAFQNTLEISPDQAHGNFISSFTNE